MRGAQTVAVNHDQFLAQWMTQAESGTSSIVGRAEFGTERIGPPPAEKCLRWFIGYDPQSLAAYNTLMHSALNRTTRPLSITPLVQDHLAGVFTREWNSLQSTGHAFTRFLVPYLCDYQGWALFTDDDMLFLDDPAKLFALIDYRYTVMVVKHPNYVPKRANKFKGRTQTTYDRKNWSSVILFNCNKCGWRDLSPERVNSMSGLDLHQFAWLKDQEIGELPVEWNHLVDEYPYKEGRKLLHYTNGGPWYADYEPGDYVTEWVGEYEEFLSETT